jgi:hypothetical protein
VHIEAGGQDLLMACYSAPGGDGNQQRRLPLAFPSDACRHFETADTRHIDVAEDDLRHEPPAEFQANKTRMGDVHLVTEQNEQLSKQVRKVFVVVDNNDLTQ